MRSERVSAKTRNSLLRSSANCLTAFCQPGGGARLAELVDANRARAIVLIDTPDASAISSAVTRLVKMSVAVLKSTRVL
jgi:hypothetical protein